VPLLIRIHPASLSATRGIFSMKNLTTFSKFHQLKLHLMNEIRPTDGNEWIRHYKISTYILVLDHNAVNGARYRDTGDDYIMKYKRENS
jgi:hypothetical protein